MQVIMMAIVFRRRFCYIAVSYTHLDVYKRQARKNNHLNKLIRQATFSDPGACLENVEYLPDRGLKQEELLRRCV